MKPRCCAISFCIGPTGKDLEPHAMPKPTTLSALIVRPHFSTLLLLAGVLACSSTVDDTPIGGGTAGANNTSGSGGSSPSAGTSSTSAGTAMVTAGTATGGSSAGSGTTAGSSNGGAAGASGGTTTGGTAVGGTSTGGGSGGGSSGGSAGSGGGGSVDCSTYKLCDDFEGGPLGMGTSPWKTQSGGGYTLELATDQAHSGTHSVHIAAPTATGSAHIVETKTFPATDYWGRAFLRFKAPPGGHQMFIMMSAPNDQIRILNMLGNSAKVQQNLQSSDKFTSSATLIPMEKWFCYEWHANTSGVHVYLDGTELADAAATWSGSGGTSLTIGYQRFQTGTAAGEIWIDDVAINTAQVGCK
jgi:hypothetical protein